MIFDTCLEYQAYIQSQPADTRIAIVCDSSTRCLEIEQWDRELGSLDKETAE